MNDWRKPYQDSEEVRNDKCKPSQDQTSRKDRAGPIKTRKWAGMISACLIKTGPLGMIGDRPIKTQKRLGVISESLIMTEPLGMISASPIMTRKWSGI